MITRVLIFVGIFVFVWIFFSLILPSLILQNFLFKTDIAQTEEIKDLAMNLSVKDKEQTLRNVHDYLIKTYKGRPSEFSLTAVLRLHKFDISKVLGNPEHDGKFFWCDSQNGMLMALLLASGQFKEKDMVVKYDLTPRLAIHQYVVVKIDEKEFCVDPFWRKFKKI
jgi:hypothetical protein